MLSFFKVNDPFRLVGVAVYLILFGSILLVFFPLPATQPTLLWMVLGERLSQGDLLYQDVIDDTGPLSAGLFTLIHLIFGRSVLVYEILGRVLIFFHIIFWNTTLIRYRVFGENTYLPAIIMAALFHFSFDMLRLSPPLLGSTFLMLALGQLFSQTILQKETGESTLLIGIYGGLAIGFHLNFLLFLPYIIFTGMAISGFSVRQLFLTLSGFLLPVLLIFLFYFWNDGLEEAFTIWKNVFGYEKYAYQPILSWLIPGIFPVILALSGFFLGSLLRGGTINQQKQRQLILLWLLFSSTVFFLVKRQASYQLLIFIPGMTYLINQFFLYFKTRFFGKLCFFLLVFGMPIGGIAYWNLRTEIDSGYFVRSSKSDENLKGKTVMVLGNDLSYLQQATSGGPFLNYHLTKSLLRDEKSLFEKARIYKRISSQKVDLIIDQEGIFKNLLEDFPLLKDVYRESRPGLFEKR